MNRHSNNVKPHPVKKNSHCYGTASTLFLNSYIGLVHDFLIFTMLLKMHFTSASLNALRDSA